MSRPDSPSRAAAAILPSGLVAWTAAILAAGTAIGLVMGAFSYFMQRWIEPSIVTLPIGQFVWIAAFNVLAWTTWLALVPLMLWLSRRVRFARAHLARAVVVHGAAALAISAVHCVLAGAIMLELLHVSGYVAGVRSARGRPTLLGSVKREFLYAYEWEVLLYACVVAASHAWRLRHEVKARELEEARLESHIVEARLEALQRQLHPHFLFNTLNTIVGLLRRDPNGAEAMIVRLGDLLRVVFKSHAHQQIRLAREIELTEQYLAIQRIRFGPALAFTTDVADAAADALVPVLLLQPFVENSVKHGFAARGGRGTVHLTARRDGDSLVLAIRDDGVGIRGSNVQPLREGVGLTNTRERLEHLYSSGYVLRVGADRQRGFSVYVELPWTVERAADGAVMSC